MSKSIVKLNASEYMTDTETTMKLYSDHIDVTVAMLPGLRYWSRPSAKALRTWADELLDGTGLVRDGAIEYRNGGPVTKWFARYYVKAVA